MDRKVVPPGRDIVLAREEGGSKRGTSGGGGATERRQAKFKSAFRSLKKPLRRFQKGEK